jgi:thioredoxin reductase (NADPH)
MSRASYEVAVVGAGPIGIEVGAVLKRAGVSFIQLERGALAEVISRWPRNTQFFSSPEWIAIAGIPIQTAGQEIVTGETYLAYLRQVVETLDLPIRTYEGVNKIRQVEEGFLLSTQALTGPQEYFVQKVILAQGDMEFPHKLGIPGEDLPTVNHYFRDPHLYFGKKVTIVGGKNSAVEAALRCWRAGAKVAISYRRQAIDENRVISRLHLEIDLLIKNGQIDFYPNTVPIAIEPGIIRLKDTLTGEEKNQGTDFVLLTTGFRADQSLLEQLGVNLLEAEQKPEFNPKTMETNVPGVYVAGTNTGGNQSSYKVFITTCHIHSKRILAHLRPELPADHPAFAVGNLPGRDYPLSSEDIE